MGSVRLLANVEIELPRGAASCAPKHAGSGWKCVGSAGEVIAPHPVCHRYRHRLDDSAARFLFDVADDDVRAFVRQGDGNRFAQALRPTLDQGHLVFEFHKGLLILDLKGVETRTPQNLPPRLICADSAVLARDGSSCRPGFQVSRASS